jgi:hypothetical protein
MTVYVGYRLFSDNGVMKTTTASLRVVPITTGALLTVNAGGYAWYTFTVPLNATTVSVIGRFVATGGSGNDIKVYILDEDGFVNFKNGRLWP